MEFRKLIKFGNSSYVVSLPKKWIIRNRLEKGAVIYIDEDKDGNLALAPGSNTPYISGGSTSTIFRNNANDASLITILNNGSITFAGKIDVNTTSTGQTLLEVQGNSYPNHAITFHHSAHSTLQGGSLGLVGPITDYGSSTYWTQLSQCMPHGVDYAGVVINHFGADGGTSYFRDFVVSDGKKGTVAYFDGSSGNVGIQTTNPYKELHIRSSTADLLINSTSDSTGNTAAIWFKVDSQDNDSRRKGAIIFERRDIRGVGKLHFAVNSSNSDDGDAGIGTTGMTID